ncbi:MFS transporter [Mangrovicella endophytica]|uniref:MFS transporter n=1 Tax=Mangrovicella endophytica TaxID=2066697 RepID=UPI000C9DAA9B|nr:MFS transporter [Mangrovicella endophytica]
MRHDAVADAAGAEGLAGEATLDRAAIVAVVLGISAFAVAQGLTYPLISLSLERLGVSASLIGLNAAVFAAGLAAATLLIRHLTTRLRGDALIVAALGGCSLALAAFSLADSLLVWFAARLLLGLCAGTVFILSEAWLHAACPDHIRGRVSGIYGAGMCLGFAAGPVAIPLVGTAHGFAFAMTAIYVAVVAFTTALLARRARTRPESVPAGALFEVLRRWPVLPVMVLAFGFADIAAISGMPIYFVRIGHSESFAALSVTVLALPTAFAQPVVGYLLDTLPRLKVGIGAGVMAAGGFLLLPLVRSDAAILLVFAVIGAASFAVMTAALTLLGERASGGLLVAGTALFSLAYAGGSASGSIITGLAMEVFAPSAAPVAVGLVLLALSLSFLADGRARLPS